MCLRSGGALVGVLLAAPKVAAFEHRFRSGQVNAAVMTTDHLLGLAKRGLGRWWGCRGSCALVFLVIDQPDCEQRDEDDDNPEQKLSHLSRSLKNDIDNKPAATVG